MKKKFIDSVRVKDPCTQSWDEMTGNDKVRFCSHCAKDVNNLSAMTRKEALRLVRRSGGTLCIRYVQHPETNAPLFSEKFVPLTRRRVPLMAAGVVTASLSLSTLTYAQGGTNPAGWRPDIGKAVECEDIANRKRSDTPASETGMIRGAVVDTNGAVIPGIAISLFGKDGQAIRKVTSDESGDFAIDNVEHGTYSLQTDAAMGFAALRMEDVSVGVIENYVRLELHVSDIATTVGGAMIIAPEFERPLVIAASAEDIDEVRNLLARGEDVNQKEPDGTTPLFAAVESGNLEIVQILLDFGAKLNARNDDKETPLMMIDEDTTVELVELLLQRGANVNRVAKNGDTALIRAAREAKPEVLGALILAGADLNAQNEEGVSALMNAADTENFENVRVLVIAGADINLRDKQGDNAWDYTAEKEIEDFLVSHGVTLDPEDLENADAEGDEPTGN